MTCPKCNGKLKVVDSVYIPDSNEYRRNKVCTKCGHEIYTIEFEVEVNERFKDEWYEYHRDRLRCKTHRGRYKKSSIEEKNYVS